MVFEKVAGLMLIVVALFLIVYFPETEDLENKAFTALGLFIGLFFLVIGIRLLLG